MMSICVYAIILLFMSIKLLSQKPPFSLSGIKMSSRDDDHIKHAIISIKWEYSWTNPLTILQRKLFTLDFTFLHTLEIGLVSTCHIRKSSMPMIQLVQVTLACEVREVFWSTASLLTLLNITPSLGLSLVQSFQPSLPPTWMKLCNKGNGSKYTPSFFSPLPLLSPFVIW